MAPEPTPFLTIVSICVRVCDFAKVGVFSYFTGIACENENGVAALLPSQRLLARSASFITQSPVAQVQHGAVATG